MTAFNWSTPYCCTPISRASSGTSSSGSCWIGTTLSALVDNLAGLSTYPTLVSDFGQLRSVCRTAAHEWLHAYLFIRPLGQNFRGSEEMFTLNETVADIAGRELGDLAFERMGGDLAESASRYVSVEEAYPFFTQTLRETRARAGELLDEGKVEEAEEHMKQQWWKLRLHGFGIRKLNQAFFAFRGRYAEGPASISPHRRAGEAGAGRSTPTPCRS